TDGHDIRSQAGAARYTDVAKARIALDVAGRAQGDAALFADEADVDIGVHGPGLEGPQDLLLATAHGGLTTEKVQQVAADGSDRCAIGGETEGELLRIQPGLAVHGGRETVFEALDVEKALVLVAGTQESLFSQKKIVGALTGRSI